MLRRARVGLDRGHPNPSELRERRGEQADTAVQVEMPGVGIQDVTVRRGGVGDRLPYRAPHGAVESRRREAVHLPESAGIHAELAFAHALRDDLARLSRPALGRIRARDHAHPAVGGLHQIDAPRSPLMQRQRGALDLGRRERIVLDRDDRVAARGERPDVAVGVDMKAHARAPAGAVGGLRLSLRSCRGVQRGRRLARRRRSASARRSAPRASAPAGATARCGRNLRRPGRRCGGTEKSA